MKKPTNQPELKNMLQEVTEFKDMMQSDRRIIINVPEISKVTVIRMINNYISDLEEIINKYEVK